MVFTSYAQNFEDALLNRALGGQAIGFYIDIGAAHPVIGSVTKAFYDRGWSGINIDPGPHFEELKSARPRDVNLRLAVLDFKGTAPFSVVPHDFGMSRVVETEDQSTEDVPCDTLANIVRDYSQGRPLDFIKIDAEGSEAKIILSTDWRKIRPRLLVIESTLPWSNILSNADWEPVLEGEGYRRVHFDGINCFYAAEEHAEALAPFFRLPSNCLDGQRFEFSVPAIAVARDNALAELGRERSAMQEAREQIGRLTGERDATQAELGRERAAAQEAREQIDHLTAEQADVQTMLSRERAALQQAREQIDRLTAERDAVQAQLEHEQATVRDISKDAGRLTVERDAALSDLDCERLSVLDAKKHAERLTGECSALLAALESERRQVEDLRVALEESRRGEERHAAESDVAQSSEAARERRQLEAAYDAMSRRADRLAGEIAAYRQHLDDKPIAALASVRGPAASGDAELSATLEALRHLPAHLEEIRLMLSDGGPLRGLAAEMERVLMTLAMEVAYDDRSSSVRERASGSRQEADRLGEAAPRIEEGLARVLNALESFRDAPARLEEIRQATADGGPAATAIRALASEIERSIMTLVIEARSEELASAFQDDAAPAREADPPRSNVSRKKSPRR